jgi:hypothetical protein
MEQQIQPMDVPELPPEKIELFERKFLAGQKPKGWKRWMGLAATNGETVFISPRVVGMSDMEAVLCCGYDATPMVTAYKYVLVPTEWLRRERRLSGAVVQGIRKMVEMSVTEWQKAKLDAEVAKLEEKENEKWQRS